MRSEGVMLRESVDGESSARHTRRLVDLGWDSEIPIKVPGCTLGKSRVEWKLWHEFVRRLATVEVMYKIGFSTGYACRSLCAVSIGHELD